VSGKVKDVDGERHQESDKTNGGGGKKKKKKSFESRNPQRTTRNWRGRQHAYGTGFCINGRGRSRERVGKVSFRLEGESGPKKIPEMDSMPAGGERSASVRPDSETHSMAKTSNPPTRGAIHRITTAERIPRPWDQGADYG